MWGHGTAIFTMLYLILLTLWLHKLFKLISLRLSSWPKPMYAEHWRKLAWATLLGNFPILLVQHVFGAIMNSFLLECATMFPIKNKFKPVILTFYFDLVPSFYFLKWNRFFWTFIAVLCESRHYFNYLLPREVCTNLQIKRFPLMKFWYKIWMYGSTDFQSNNIERHPYHKYLLFLKFLKLQLSFDLANNHNLIVAKRFTKNSQNSLTSFYNITPWYWQIKILPLW